MSAHHRHKVIVALLGRPHWLVYAVVPLILVVCAAAVRAVGLPATMRSHMLRSLGRKIAQIRPPKYAKAYAEDATK